MTCESQWEPGEVSWDGSSYGLFQVNSIHVDRFPDFWRDWADPALNMAWAHELWLEQGWVPWRASASCHGAW